ncbi:serine/threonine kinase PknH [Microdochium nivale]|nr:serine/threonine kinase PknH [Microdochium nivale]
MEAVRPHVDLEVDEAQWQCLNANDHSHNNYNYYYDGNSGYDFHNSKHRSSTSFAAHFKPTAPGRPEVAEGLERGVPPSMQRRTWLVPAAIAAGVAALLVGAAVGGGLGASLSSCRSELRTASTLLSAETNTAATETITQPGPAGSNSGFSTTTTTTNGLFVGYKPAAPAMVDTISVDCRALAAQPQKSLAQIYSAYCGVDLSTGSRPAMGGGSVAVADMVGIVAYSLEACLDACSTVNVIAYRAKTETKCHAVTFRWDLAKAWERSNANCWLKNATASIQGAKQCDRCLTAIRVD